MFMIALAPPRNAPRRSAPTGPGIPTRCSTETRFRLLVQNSQDVLFRAELFPHFHHSYVSPSVASMLGYTPEEVYADPTLFFRTIHPDDRPYFEALIGNRETPPSSIVMRFISKDGRVVWTEQRCTPICDDDGQLVAVEGIVRDITERKHTEEALRASRQMLRDVLNHFPGAVCWKDIHSVYLGCNEACAKGAGCAIRRTGRLRLDYQSGILAERVTA